MKKIIIGCKNNWLVVCFVCLSSCGGCFWKIADPKDTQFIAMQNTGRNRPSAYPSAKGNDLILGDGAIWIAQDNNFHCNFDVESSEHGYWRSPTPPHCHITAVGEVTGLGYIKKIPENGYVETVPVKPKYGYIVKTRGNTYARLYVVDWIIDANGEIAGANVKYQYPFKPKSSKKRG